jgi:hypothetical protein
MKCYIPGYNAVSSVESQPTFRGNTSPPSLGSKVRQVRNQHEAGNKQSSCWLTLRPWSWRRPVSAYNVGCLSTDYTALYPRRQNSSQLVERLSKVEEHGNPGLFTVSSTYFFGGGTTQIKKIILKKIILQAKGYELNSKLRINSLRF